MSEQKKVLHAAANPDQAQTDIEKMAVNRYRPVPDGLLSYKVVGGDGVRSLFSGTKDQCQIVARKMTEAFLDGAHVALQSKPDQVAVPEGWKLVPTDPTDDQLMEMYDAIKEVHEQGCGTYGECGGNSLAEAKAAYGAMLNAAPQPEQVHQDVPCINCNETGSVQVYEDSNPATRATTVDCQKCKGNGYTIEPEAQQPTAPGGEAVATIRINGYGEFALDALPAYEKLPAGIEIPLSPMTSSSVSVGDVEELARKLYTRMTNNDPVVHSNRFATWDQLSDSSKAEWIAKATSQLFSDTKPQGEAVAELGNAQPLIARAKSEWQEDDGPVMWWAWCGHEWAGEPAWCGSPTDSDWPGYHTHWTPHPKAPAKAIASVKVRE